MPVNLRVGFPGILICASFSRWYYKSKLLFLIIFMAIWFLGGSISYGEGGEIDFSYCEGEY